MNLTNSQIKSLLPIYKVNKKVYFNMWKWKKNSTKVYQEIRLVTPIFYTILVKMFWIASFPNRNEGYSYLWAASNLH